MSSHLPSKEDLLLNMASKESKDYMREFFKYNI